MEKLADLLHWCSLIVERLSGSDLLRGIKTGSTGRILRELADWYAEVARHEDALAEKRAAGG